MRLGVSDHKVIRAFVERRAFDGYKLSTDGQRIDGHWLGGARIAEWKGGRIVLNDLGSRVAQQIHRQIRYHAAPNDIARDRRRTRRRR